MTTLATLKANGCRIDGLTWDETGHLIFVATNAGGSWTDEQKAKVLQVLGRRPPS